MYDTKTASQSSVERGSLGASKAMRTHALGETRPLVRSIGMEIETQAPSSTPRRGRQTAIGDLGADQQEQPAFDMTHTCNSKPEVEARFGKPLTVVTNQARALFGNTQRLVPALRPYAEDDAVTEIFHPRSAAPRFDGNATVKIAPQSASDRLCKTQLLRSSTLLDLELPQVARGTCSNHWGKTQVIPPTAEAEAEPSRPKLCTGSVTSGNTTPAPRSMQTPSMRTHSVGTPAPSPDGAIGAASRSAACKQQETGLRAQHDTPAPTTARSTLLDFDKTLELRHATTPLAAQSEQLPSSLRFNSLDPGVTQVLPVEDLVARRNQVTNGGAPVGSRKDPTRVEVLQRRVSETVMGRWQKLPKLTRAAFALALFGALLWGANAECESHPQVPVVALATPVKPSAAVATEPSSGTERGSTATAHGSAPLPPVDPRSTMERTAVDATAEGRYGVAIRLYETLADAHPENPVYREAARILSARTQQRF